MGAEGEFEACPKCAPRIAALEGLVEELRAEVKELRRRLDQNSSNSSKPPSSDPPWAKQSAKKKSGRPRGGQPGHKGHWRALLPPEKVDVFVACKPQSCEGCGASLEGEDPSPQRHQVTEVPELRTELTEYQLHALECASCGQRTRAGLPPGVSGSAFGPRLTMFVSLLSGAYLLSKRQVEQLLADCFGAELCIGSVSTLEQRMSESLAAPVQQLHEHLKQADAANIDETSWKQSNQPGYLWAAVGELYCVFLVRLSRARSCALELLGAFFEGVVTSDRYSVYEYFKNRQICWSHLVRDFRSIASRGGLAEKIGEELLACAWAMFHQWHRFKRAEIAVGTLLTYMSRTRVRLRLELERGRLCGDPRTEGLCQKLLAREKYLWTFVRLEGIEPTNNAAERALRPAVLWRKRSFGTQSERGSRFVERILTTITTLRLQKRNVLDYLTAAYQARLHNQPAPSLLPLT